MHRYRTHYSTEIKPEDDGKEVRVAGWVQDIRNLGSIAFLILRDRKGTLQVTLFKKEHPFFEKVVSLPRESVVSVMGKCKANEKVRNGYEIIPEKIDILSTSEKPLPLGVVDKVGVEFDTRLDNRFIDLRKPEVQAIFKIRDVVIDAAREFLREEGFIEVHTPKIVASCSEGGTNLFEIKYFDKKAFLSQSPQLYKQMLMATGLDRVFEIAWYFRAEEHNTRRHLNESTAIDVEMAFISGEEDVMHVLELLVQNIWKRVKECEEELSLLGKDIEVPNIPFPRMKYTDLVEMLKDRGMEVRWGDDFGSREEREIGKIMEEKGNEMYFITEYPLDCKPFYTMPKDNNLSRSFDLGCKGMEIASGSQRIHDVNLLIERLKANGLNPKDFEDYLRAFRYGMPPHGGFGLGIERLLMVLLDLANIRECILFPRDRTRLHP